MEKRRTVLLRRSTRCVGGNTGGPSPSEHLAERSKNQRAILNIPNKSGLSGDGGNCCNDSVYKLKWNLQSQHLLKELGNIYGHGHCQGPRVEDETDVTLFSSEGGGCISAHRIVLMMCSPYFRKLFAEVSKSRRKGNDNAIVILGNVPTAAQLHNLVRFIYTGEVDLTSEIDLGEFTKITQQFGLEGVSTSTSSAPSVEVTVQKRNKPIPNKVSKIKLIVGQRAPQKAKVGGDNDEAVVSNETGNQKEYSVIRVISSSTLNKKDDIRNETAASENSVGTATVSEVITCKNEPSDDVYSNDDVDGGDDTNFITMQRGDDEASNFSDDFRNNSISSEEDDDLVNDPDVSFDSSSGRSNKGRNRPSKRSSSQGEGDEDMRLDPRTGKFRNWTRIDAPPEEEFKRDWRIKNILRCASNTSRIYYCPYGGKKCPAQIKIKILWDGTQVYFRNACEHANHRDPNYHFGLTPDQKQFILDCLQAGVTQPANILLKFDMSGSGVRKPKKIQLSNMLQRFKKKFPEYWKKKEPSKWPKRIRRRPEKVEPPKKRGRPSGTLPAATSPMLSSASQGPPPAPLYTAPTSTSSPSSSPVPVSSSSLVNFPAHPNHYMGQASFCFNPNTPSITHHTVIQPPPLDPFDHNNFR